MCVCVCLITGLEWVTPERSMAHYVCACVRGKGVNAYVLSYTLTLFVWGIPEGSMVVLEGLWE